MNYIYSIIIIICMALVFSGCEVLRATKDIAVVTGKLAVETAKATGKVATAAGKVVVGTGKAVKTLVEIPFGKNVIQLSKRGNSYLVDALLNRKQKGVFLLDTGCTDTQISTGLANRLGIDINKGERVLCNIAGGGVVAARAVTIKELRVGKARIYNVRAFVLEADSTSGYDGLLGMAFLSNFNFKIDTEKSQLILEKK